MGAWCFFPWGGGHISLLIAECPGAFWWLFRQIFVTRKERSTCSSSLACLSKALRKSFLCMYTANSTEFMLTPSGRRSKVQSLCPFCIQKFGKRLSRNQVSCSKVWFSHDEWMTQREVGPSFKKEFYSLLRASGYKMCSDLMRMSLEHKTKDGQIGTLLRSNLSIPLTAACHWELAQELIGLVRPQVLHLI